MGDRYITPILMGLVVATGPHVTRLPLWVIVWCLLLWGYAWLGQARRVPRPGRVLKVFLALAGIWAAMATFGHISGRDVGVAMLAVLLGLKPLEISTHRDRMVTLFLSYFLVLSNMFYSQTLLMSLYLVAAVWVITTILIHLNQRDLPAASAVRLAGRLMLQAAPLMLVMFILFPRLPGSIFRLPDPTVSLIGFGDTLEPGDLVRLVRGRQVAFRAEFEGAAPPAENRYWRGLVLWAFDGAKWTRGFEFPDRSRPIAADRMITYTLTLEPHNQNRLFALDLPVRIPEEARLKVDHTLVLRDKLNKRQRYRLTSATRFNNGPVRAGEKRLGLRLPAGGNERARALAKSWAEKAAGPEDIVRAALGFFRAEPFYYSLEAPALGADRIDDFLYKTRRGYCEHYASSFTFLMRAAGVPARVVVGYLGGEVNPLGDYMIVKQSDAHAWAEVALPGRGWVRVDPTAAVAPERVERGMEAALSPEELRYFFSADRLGNFYAYWVGVRYRWDRVNFLWNKWVLDYTYQRQKNMLDRLGIRTGSYMGTVKVLVMALGAAGLLSLTVILWLTRDRWVVRRDGVRRAYDRISNRLERSGLGRRPNQGPRDYEDMVSRARPDLQKDMEELMGLYIRIRYGRESGPGDVRRFRSAARRFHPGRRPKQDDVDSLKDSRATA